MLYNKHYLNVILRVSFITLTSLGLAFAVFKISDWLLIMNIILLLGLQVYLFIRSMNKTNSDLESFFSSLENNDTSISLNIPKHYSSYRKLLVRLNILKDKLLDLRRENEKQLHYLKAVVENLGVGLILCDSSGEIELVNDAGKKILSLPNIKNLGELDALNEKISCSLLNLNSGNQKMFRLNIAGDSRPIAFRVNDYRAFDRTTRIISFQNIKNELDSQELEAWQKLFRVLTHEIMNSTVPITSSIDSIKEFLTDEYTRDIKALKDINEETIHDVLKGIEIIKERSVGLSEFVRNFRNLTIKPKISIKKLKLEEMFNHIRFILSEALRSKQIDLTISIIPKNLDIVADIQLIEQVILNLVYNSIEALDNIPQKKIRLNGHKNQLNQLVIQVIDNGRGISEELMDKIFVPFFTTKEKGSGIGLSISRQIIQWHAGIISVKSTPLIETCFEIYFTE
jgi:two-component system, NtrC family, nitrogen regulation sensor histidine kinase NtrY